MISTGDELHPSTSLAQRFQQMFADCLELRQHDFTSRRLARDIASATRYSRLHIIYTNLHPGALETLSTTVGIRGDLHAHEQSDHRATTAQTRPRLVRPPSRVKQYGVQHECFQDVLTEELQPSCASARQELPVQIDLPRGPSASTSNRGAGFAQAQGLSCSSGAATCQ